MKSNEGDEKEEEEKEGGRTEGKLSVGGGKGGRQKEDKN